MRRIYLYLAVFGLFLGAQASTKAQDILVPAGTLLRCTMDEPDLSSKTADIGDPVICHLAALRQFGKAVFPRGKYLGGHLEADKEPGHFWGKGYLKIEFDRIGFPESDIPVPSKIIAAKGYRVDKKGDIVGKGHATRDTVEWLIPPLWPWKILTLPARGPRPTLKGEEQITVRLMDDIDVPRPGGSLRSYERPPAPASYHSQSFRKPVALKNSEKPANDAPDISEIGYEANNPAPGEARHKKCIRHIRSARADGPHKFSGYRPARAGTADRAEVRERVRGDHLPDQWRQLELCAGERRDGLGGSDGSGLAGDFTAECGADFRNPK